MGGHISLLKCTFQDRGKERERKIQSERRDKHRNGMERRKILWKRKKDNAKQRPRVDIKGTKDRDRQSPVI